MALPPKEDVDHFFGQHEESRRIFDALASAVRELGPIETRISKSQVAFWRDHPFAWAWVPDQYLKQKTAPLVLTVPLRRRDTSARWKQVVEPASGRFTHHLELWSVSDVDSEVAGWLREAWDLAGPTDRALPAGSSAEGPVGAGSFGPNRLRPLLEHLPEKGGDRDVPTRPCSAPVGPPSSPGTNIQ